MNDERMKILQMIEDQKIDVDSAIKLLDALKDRKHGFKKHHDHQGYHGHRGFDRQEVEVKLQKFANQMDCFAKDLGNKMDCAFKEMEPKVKKATHKALEKSAVVLADLSRLLNERLEKEACCAEEKEGCCSENMEQNCGCSEAHDGCCEPPKSNDGYPYN